MVHALPEEAKNPYFLSSLRLAQEAEYTSCCIGDVCFELDTAGRSVWGDSFRCARGGYASALKNVSEEGLKRICRELIEERDGNEF